MNYKSCTQLMNSSLDILVKSLLDNDFKLLSQEFIGEQLKLVKQKGVYPYEFVDSFENLSEDRCKFYSCLEDVNINKKNYLHANNVWNVFKMNTMSYYRDLYLKTDVVLLADTFEKFISTCLEHYGLVIIISWAWIKLGCNAQND